MGQEARSILGKISLKDTRNKENTLPLKSIHPQTLARHVDELQTPAGDQCNNQEDILPRSLILTCFPFVVQPQTLGFLT